MHIPSLNLSHGQVLHIIARGEQPTKRLQEQIRYFRRHGIPCDVAKISPGKGRCITYTFDDLLELAIAVHAYALGMEQRNVANHLRRNGHAIKTACQIEFFHIPKRILNEPREDSGGGFSLGIKELFLLLYNSDQRFEIKKDSLENLIKWNRNDSKSDCIFISITRLLVELFILTKTVPKIHRGTPSQKAV
jgi:hypothetical protein